LPRWLSYRDSYGHRRSPRLEPDSVQQGEQLRPLPQPGDIRALPPNEQLVFVTGFPPIRATRIRYYADRAFKHRVLPPPDQSLGIDAPHGVIADTDWGVPNDWHGERAKGQRIRREDDVDGNPVEDEEWTPPEVPNESEPDSDRNKRGRDRYAL